ncbi:MAG: glycoside hydrolase [Phycisphaerales bacterium]|nr:glycoside hydrolase [Phycisphaerales bacterium]
MTTHLLKSDTFAHYADAFSAGEPEGVVNLIPDAKAWQWISANAPLFECPDPTIQKIYYYRWWTFRKHIKQTPVGRIVTEFITPVRHAASHNAISCALGHHLAEGRWLADQSFLDEYVKFWFIANNGQPEPKFHGFSSWLAAALVDRANVTGDWMFVENMLDDLIADFAHWKQERRIEDGPHAGLYWQYDVRDGMEESITGSRKIQNARPTISTYMFAYARAIATIAKRAGREDVAHNFEDEAQALKRRVQTNLWDKDAQFFKATVDAKHLSDAREAIDFIPWTFNLPDAGYEAAWKQLPDPAGFWAPAGLTTAERRHPKFRSNGVGRCEWDGACWPFATSQTVDAMANVLRHYKQDFITRQYLLESIQIYAKAHHKDGHCYIGEYHDEVTGEWLKGDNPRSDFYNHSTYADLVIHHLVGLVARSDNVIEVDPLLPAGAWPWFCLDGVSYHGQSVTVLWDETGERYGRGKGLRVLLNGNEIGQRANLGRLECAFKK